MLSTYRELIQSLHFQLRELNYLRKQHLRWIIRNFVKRRNFNFQEKSKSSIEKESFNKHITKAEASAMISNMLNEIKSTYESVKTLDLYLESSTKHLHNNKTYQNHILIPWYADSISINRTCKRIVNLSSTCDQSLLFNIGNLSKNLASLKNMDYDVLLPINSKFIHECLLNEDTSCTTSHISQDRHEIFSPLKNKDFLFMMKSDSIISNLTVEKLTKYSSVYPRKAPVHIAKAINQMYNTDLGIDANNLQFEATKYISSNINRYDQVNIKSKINAFDRTDPSNYHERSRSAISKSFSSCQKLKKKSHRKNPSKNAMSTKNQKQSLFTQNKAFKLAFEDNIIIPYADCTPQQIEHIPYKEILVPEWTVVKLETIQDSEAKNSLISSSLSCPSNSKNDDAGNISNPSQFTDGNSNKSECDNEILEDISDEAYIRRHAVLEIQERNRYNSFSTSKKSRKTA